MAQHTLVATSSFGLESVVAQELRDLGYQHLRVENGMVIFEGDGKDIAWCNVRLRTADRVLVKMGEFMAADFEELFEGTKKIKWEDVIPADGKIHVVGKSVHSRLSSVPDCQAVVKKAIVEAIKRRYKVDILPETGALFKTEISLRKDVALLTLDTTGHGLHKRGYREQTGEAPIRENLAAALVLLSRWNPSRILADPLCGSGTIPIEAALIGRNIAPGIQRSFASESWGCIPLGIWEEARRQARAEEHDVSLKILASDSDSLVLKKARINAQRAGVESSVVFQRLAVEHFRSRWKYGCIVCNPPYGQRIGGKGEVERLYTAMGKVFKSLDTWSFFILTAHPDFEALFGRKADRNRKLYNGDMKCYLYEFFGPLPPRKARAGRMEQGGHATA